MDLATKTSFIRPKGPAQRERRAKSLHYDRMVRLPPRRRSLDLQPRTIRRSARVSVPVKRMNYSYVKCCVCNKRFFGDIMAQFYDKHSVCSVACLLTG